MQPEVTFTTATVDETISLINTFINGDWGEGILNNLPDLKRKLQKTPSKKQREKITYDYFKRIEEKHDLKKKAEHFQQSWNKINNQAMKELENVMEIKWPKSHKEITARVNFNQVCPRYLENKIFDLNYFQTNKTMKETTLHEILHFLWFVKCKKVFPKIPKERYDDPFLFWKLSEMVPAIILNDKRIQKVFKHKAKVYSEFYPITINNKPLLTHLQEIYDTRKDMEDFMRKSWEFIKKHQKEINKTFK